MKKEYYNSSQVTLIACEANIFLFGFAGFARSGFATVRKTIRMPKGASRRMGILSTVAKPLRAKPKGKMFIVPKVPY